MQKLFSIFVLTAIVFSLHAQDKFFTKSGNITFISKGSLETIEANHKAVTCVLDTKTGNLQFSVLMKGFEFEKALMQEHFNENYVESDKFPKAEFKGVVINNAEVNYSKEGTYPVIVKGKLTLHGETKDTETNGLVIIKGGKIQATSSFNILLSDYKIDIPKIVKDNITNSVKIDVNCKLEPLKS